MEFLFLIFLGILLLIGAGVIFFSLADNVAKRRTIFENIALKKNGKVVSNKALKLLVPFRNGEIALAYEKRWVKTRHRGHHRNTLNRVSLASFQFTGRTDESFNIFVKDPVTTVAFGMLDGMLQDMSARTGIQVQGNSALEEFVVMSSNPAIAQGYLSLETRQALLQIKDVRPTITFHQGHFELVIHKKIETEPEWEDLLDRAQLLVGRLDDLLRS